MEKTKRKNDTAPSRRTWRFFIALALFLLLMVKFPIRVLIDEVLLDSLIWGAIVLGCVVVAVRTVRRFGKQVWRLVGVMVLCAGLAGWQVVDLVVLRERNLLHLYGCGMSDPADCQIPSYVGKAYYIMRFPNPIICRDMFIERFIGNDTIAITTLINREGSWFSCGG